jgi:fructokinase
MIESNPSIPSKPVIVGVGEFLWDCFNGTRRAGGAPANVAFHANQFGNEGIVCTRVGSDTDGDELIEHGRKHDLCTDFIQRDPEKKTGRVTVDATRPDHPTYTIHEDVAWDHIEWNDDVAKLANRAAAVCFGTLAQRSSNSRDTIQRFLAETKGLRVCDINLRPPWFDESIIRSSLQQCDILKMNHNEINSVTEVLGIEANDDREVGDRLLKQFDLTLLSVTRAEHGCIFQTQDHRIELPGRKIEVADAVGSGDAFSAAMITGLVNLWPLDKTARVANAIGAEVATHNGAMPFLKDRFHEIKAEESGG